MNKHSDELKMLGLNISFYRKYRGYSQSKLAEMIDISRTHMSRIETAQCEVSIHILLDICEALQISPKELFDWHKI